MLTDGWPVTAALDPVTGNPDVQYTSDEHAAILAGLVVRDVDGAPRAGVMPRHTNALVTARPDMKVDVAPFEAVLVNAGIRMIALTEQLTLDVTAAQNANTRYDIVYVEATDRALTGVKSTSAVKIATGQPGPIPQDPAVPAGSVRLARLTITANATATNSGVTITAIHQFTATTMGVILFRTLDEMNAWSAPSGQDAYVLTAGAYTRAGSVWRGRGQLIASSGSISANPPLGSVLLEIVGVVNATTGPTGAQNIALPGGGFPNGIVSMTFTLTNNSQADDVRLVQTSTTKASFQVFAPGKANTFVEMAIIAKGW
jgi:hypothetical protein